MKAIHQVQPDLFRPLRSKCSTPTIDQTLAEKEGALNSVLSWKLIPDEVYTGSPTAPSVVYGSHHLLRLFGEFAFVRFRAFQQRERVFSCFKYICAFIGSEQLSGFLDACPLVRFSENTEFIEPHANPRFEAEGAREAPQHVSAVSTGCSCFLPTQGTAILASVKHDPVFNPAPKLSVQHRPHCRSLFVHCTPEFFSFVQFEKQFVFQSIVCSQNLESFLLSIDSRKHTFLSLQIFGGEERRVVSGKCVRGRV